MPGAGVCQSEITNQFNDLAISWVKFGDYLRQSMASITAMGEKFRAQVYCHGQRRSKLCNTREEAEVWAEKIEGRLRAAVSSVDEVVPRRMLLALEALPHSLSDVLASVVKAPTSCGIYFLVKDMEVIYVGQSVDLFNRISKHRRAGVDFDSYSFIECERRELDALEMMYVTAFMPKQNWTFGGQRKVPMTMCSTANRLMRNA